MYAAFKTSLFAIAALGLGAVAWMSSPQPNTPPRPTPVAEIATTQPVEQPAPQTKPPLVQIALLLDTSSSMDNLIKQAQSQLWAVVNQMSEAERNGQTPQLEIALYEYGNDGLSAESGFIRRVSPFTSSLDEVSEKLFALSTNGGEEYAPMAVKRALKELEWSPQEETTRLIFVAGNESFQQGPVSIRNATKIANAAGVTVNTIFCGAQQDLVAATWQTGSSLAGGSFFVLNHNRALVRVKAPQDEELARLNKELNETYLPLGAIGAQNLQRQRTQDQNALSLGRLGTRVRSKSTPLYRNESWDLVDGLKTGKIELSKVKESELPKQLQGKSEQEKKAFVQQKDAARAKLKTRIKQLYAERQAYIAKNRTEQKDAIDDKMMRSIRAQAQKKGLSFKK